MRKFCSMAVAAVALGMAAPAAAQYGQPVEVPFRAGFYLRGGTMTATGDYAAQPSNARMIFQTREAAEVGLNSGMAATSGYYAELGRLTYLRLPLPQMLRAGIDVAVAAGAMRLGWDDIYHDAEQLPEALADARIGPAISVMPVPGLRFDASLKFGVGVVGGSSYDGTFTTAGNQTVYVGDSHDELASGSSRSFTLSARYGGFTAGWEMHTMNVERARLYDASVGNSSTLVGYTGSVSPSTSRLFIGFAR
jgi:opacity protein-like surface antigen